MKVVKALFAFYINASIHVAFAVTALVGVTHLSFKLELNWIFYAFIFFGTITGYNFVKYAKVAGLHHRSLASSLKTIQVFSGVCAVALFLVTLQLPLKVLLYTAGLGILTFFYAVPLLFGYNLRSLGGLKIVVVAIVWAGLTVIIPLVYAERTVDIEISLLLVQRFIFVLVWILPFEIRDVSYDKLSLGTMPQRLGVNRTKVIGLVLIVLALGCEYYMNNDEVWKISAVFLTAIISGIAMLKSKTTQGNYFASFWVEGIPVLWYLLAYLFIQFSF